MALSISEKRRKLARLCEICYNKMEVWQQLQVVETHLQPFQACVCCWVADYLLCRLEQADAAASCGSCCNMIGRLPVSFLCLCSALIIPKKVGASLTFMPARLCKIWLFTAV